MQFVRLMSGSLPTRMRTSRGRRGLTGALWCRAGCSFAETQAHIIQTCPRTRGGRILRHHALVRFIHDSLRRRRYNVHREVWLGRGPGSWRPDLVVIRDGCAWVLDIQVVSPSRKLNVIAKEKADYYNRREVVERVAALFGVEERFVRFGALTISWKGIWSSDSASLFRGLGLQMRQLSWLTGRVLRGSHINWSRWNAMALVSTRGQTDMAY